MTVIRKQIRQAHEELREAYEACADDWYDPYLDEVCWNVRYKDKKLLRNLQQAHKNFKRKGRDLKDAPFYPELKRVQYLIERYRFENQPRIHLEMFNPFLGKGVRTYFTCPKRAVRWLELVAGPFCSSWKMRIVIGLSVDSVEGKDEIRQVLAKLKAAQ